MASLGGEPSFNVPQVQVLRPLTAGMVTDAVSAGAPDGSFQSIEGFDVVPSGLRRSWGWSAPGSLPTYVFADEQPEDFFQFASSDGNTIPLLLTNRALYAFAGSSFSPVPWAAEDYSYVDLADDTFTVEGEDLTELVEAGDAVQIGTEVRYVSSVTLDGSDSVVVVTEDWVDAGATGTNVFVKQFSTGSDGFVDWATGRDSTYIVNGTVSGMYRFAGTYLEWYEPLVETGGAVAFTGAKTIACFRDRLYFGGIIGGASSRGSTEIRWTDVLDWGIVRATSYQDLSYRPGAVQRIRGSTELLMVFTTDAVYYGRQTNLVGLPYAFYELETGGSSLLGPRAVSSILNGIVYAGPDDIYLFQNPQDSGPQATKIATTVADQMLLGMVQPEKTRVFTDVQNSRVAILVADSSGAYNEVWWWSYLTKSWAKTTQLSAKFLCVGSLITQHTFTSVLSDTNSIFYGKTYTDVIAMGMSFESVINRPTVPDVFAVTESKFLRLSRSQTSIDGINLTTLLETQDFDYDLPDQTKSWLGIGIRLKDLITEQLNITVEVSIEGKTWRSLGILRVAQNTREAKLAFRATGSVARFRLSAVSPLVESWTISELTFKVRARGPEVLRQ